MTSETTSITPSVRARYEHVTRKGSRVFRAAKIVHGQAIYSPNYTFVVKRGSRHSARTMTFPLGTADKQEAGRLADKIADYLRSPEVTLDMALEKFLPKIWERRQPPAPDPMPEKKRPAVGELLTCYRQHYTRDRDSTKAANITALRRIAAFICGEAPLSRKRTKEQIAHYRATADALEVDKITPSALNRFKADLFTRAGKDQIALGRARTTANAYMRAARTFFSKRLIATGIFDDFIMPASPFADVPDEEEPTHQYSARVDIDGLITNAAKDLPALDRAAGGEPGTLAAFTLALWAGLSRSEMDKLLWEQVDLEAGTITIKTTKHYRPKRRSRESVIRVSEGVLTFLRDFRETRRVAQLHADFVLPGGAPEKRLRCIQVFRRLSKWLRKQGFEGKTLHDLRKEAGSLIYRQTGSVDRAAQFLRNDPRTAREHYVDADEGLVVNFALPAR